eukprot:6212062-Pleurochrysis_carterae.AAC.2
MRSKPEHSAEKSAGNKEGRRRNRQVRETRRTAVGAHHTCEAASRRRRRRSGRREPSRDERSEESEFAQPVGVGGVGVVREGEHHLALASGAEERVQAERVAEAAAVLAVVGHDNLQRCVLTHCADDLVHDRLLGADALRETTQHEHTAREKNG